LFEGIALTPESARRKQYYEEDHVRQMELESSVSYESFLAGLDIKLRPQEIVKNRDRAIELINKTNQFNLTTRRFGWSRIEEILARGGLAFCFRSEDRFGDYGIISVMILDVLDERSYRIDTWVMSCRVMGRTVERAILAYVVDELAKRGATHIVGEYIPSGKNAPVSSLYASLGFRKERSEGTSMFSELEVATVMAEQINPYIKIIMPSTAENSI
jgi:FkbH-like protein